MKDFVLTRVERDRVDRFIKKHTYHSDTISYNFVVDFNIAFISKSVKCLRCNKSENITEF